MKVLIQDTQPDRLLAWLSQMARPGRVCHLANTHDQARYMLMSDPYDMVLLDSSHPQGAPSDLAELALQNNPACQIVDLPDRAGTDGLEQTEDAAGPADSGTDPAPNGPVRWRRIGASAQRVVTEPSGVTWRSYRRQKLVDAPEVPEDVPQVAARSEPLPLPGPRLHIRPAETKAQQRASAIGQALRQRSDLAASV